VFRFQGRML